MPSKKRLTKHKHTIFYFGIALLLIIQISSIVIVTSELRELKELESQLAEKIASTKTELENKIIESNLENQAKINEISKSLMATESSLKSEISSLKAKTSDDFSGIIETAVKGVVSIQTDVSQGTGFLVNEEGYIITNAHVLVGASFVKSIDYSKETRFSQLVGFDSELDLALLKIGGEDHDFLRFERKVVLGEKVVAIGNPLGLSFSVTEGIVSAMDRPANANNDAEYIQTDAALNPGNSGGPLINTEGRVVGINNFKIGGAEGIGFALESRHIIPTINILANETIV